MELQVTGAEKQMEAQYRAAAEASDQWRRRAEWALRRDDEELAREALKRRKTFEVRSASGTSAADHCATCLLACCERQIRQYGMKGLVGLLQASAHEGHE